MTVLWKASRNLKLRKALTPTLLRRHSRRVKVRCGPGIQPALYFCPCFGVQGQINGGPTALEPRDQNAVEADPPAVIEASFENKDDEKSAVIDPRPSAASTPAPTTHQVRV